MPTPPQTATPPVQPATGGMSADETASAMPPPAPPSWRAMLAAFGRIGLLSFGGPAAQISIMHEELVERRQWLSEQGFLGALSFCMLLPGPEAMQLATYAGWLKRGVAGGLLAGLFFVLPGAVVIAVLALLYVEWGTIPTVQSAFLGIQALVVAIVLQAMVRLSRKALRDRLAYGLAAGSFALIFFLGTPFPLIILAAGLMGAGMGHVSLPSAIPAGRAGPTAARTAATITLWLVLWMLPVALVWLSGDRFLTQITLFFSKLAVISFGGAYALLAWMTQTVVQVHGWLTAQQMMDALGLAETTPGPLILVTQFVSTVAAALRAGPAYGLTAGALVLWVTFIPCFLFIFAFAPHVERLLAQPRLAAALAGITAAVVGVIASLAIWFTLHVLFDVVTQRGALPIPHGNSFQPLAAGLVAIALWIVFAGRLRLGMAICVMAALGILGGYVLR